jgi:hypothetical protein
MCQKKILLKKMQETNFKHYSFDKNFSFWSSTIHRGSIYRGSMQGRFIAESIHRNADEPTIADLLQLKT